MNHWFSSTTDFLHFLLLLPPYRSFFSFFRSWTRPLFPFFTVSLFSFINFFRQVPNIANGTLAIYTAANVSAGLCRWKLLGTMCRKYPQAEHSSAADAPIRSTHTCILRLLQQFWSGQYRHVVLTLLQRDVSWWDKLKSLFCFFLEGKNALHLASRNGHSLCVQKLLQVNQTNLNLCSCTSCPGVWQAETRVRVKSAVGVMKKHSVWEEKL